MLKAILATVLLAQSVIATCPSFKPLSDEWNVILSGDLTLLSSDFEGKSYVGGTATLSNFALGMKLNLQCSQDPVLSAAKVNAYSGNFCGGAVAGHPERLELVGSNIGCSQTGQDCSVKQVAGLANPWSKVDELNTWVAGLKPTGHCQVDADKVLTCSTNMVQSPLHVFHLDTWTARVVAKMPFNKGTTVVFVVKSASVDLSAIDTNNLNEFSTLFYVPGTNVKMGGTSYKGGLLAPNAVVEATNGNITGFLYAKTMSTPYGEKTLQMNISPFSWNCPPAIHCPEGTTLNADLSNCICANPTQSFNKEKSVCECPPGQTLQADKCSCPATYEYNGAQCVLPPCPVGQSRDANGQCVAPPPPPASTHPTYPVSSVNPMTSNQPHPTYPASSHPPATYSQPPAQPTHPSSQCKAGEKLEGYKCVSICPATQKWDGYACVCPAGTIKQGDKCVAKAVVSKPCTTTTNVPQHVQVPPTGTVSRGVMPTGTGQDVMPTGTNSDQQGTNYNADFGYKGLDDPNKMAEQKSGAVVVGLSAVVGLVGVFMF